MIIGSYINALAKHYKSGHATEHTYRGDLARLIQKLVPSVDVTNEPSKVTDCGNPDYIISSKKIPIGFIEAKDIGKDLSSKQYKEQFERYRKALDNLIITDYMSFEFYRNGEKTHQVKIANIVDGEIKALPENFDSFSSLINDFCIYITQTIKSSKTLAKMMAGKAKLLENIIVNAVTSDEESEQNSELINQYKTFKDVLIHDLTPAGFADIYAQTLAYGMFAARLHDKNLDTFSRQEAAELIPKTNPFLRKLFNHVAGIDIDERIITTVDNLADVFRATNVEELIKSFGEGVNRQDPIIHFYETFLAEYDPKLRKSKGVWYTPEPVVKFIVRGVDKILRNEFDLKDGLADISKTTVEVEAQGTAITKGSAKGKRLTEVKEVHKVQVLDPATGTGTFLAEVIKFIYYKKFNAIPGAWSSYVEEHLIPRLNGFELLMASYSMAHLKLDLLLTETGYQSKKNSRFNIFLTNSLEEYHPDTGTLFSSWLSTEANEANNIKRDTPVMVVMGNPPYSSVSSNNNKWINCLVDVYKEGLNEKKSNLNDDYIKFIRFGQHLIDKNGDGVLAFITNNSFVDGITHREMRRSLINSFNKIYILNLHGDSNKREKSPDGSKDENVFDITQGVSIVFLIKSDHDTVEIKQADIYGTRKYKYEILEKSSLEDIAWNTINPSQPYWFFYNKDESNKEEYELGFYVTDLFPRKDSGIETGNDNVLAAFTKEDIHKLKEDLLKLSSDEISLRYKYSKSRAKQVKENYLTSEVYDINILYRPFDYRYSLYSKNSQGVLWRPRSNVLFSLNKKNIALTLGRQTKNQMISHYFVSDRIIEKKYSEASTQCYCIPLYLYPEQESLNEKIININSDIVAMISENINIKYNPTTANINISEECFDEVNIFDYCYAVLFSNNYRDKYYDYLKIDFPRIPYPKNKEIFIKLSSLGSKLRKLHLLESSSVDNYISTYPENGNNKITNKIHSKDWELYCKESKLGKIWINENQYFDLIPLDVWEFYVGGYQPAQKWLKDRVNKTLSFDDILHYQKIIASLDGTIKIMKEIDDIDF